MAVFLSPVGGAGAQFFDANGTPLSGGKLYTYSAGTTTPAVTYTSSAGNVSHSNPIILDAAGRVPGSSEIWLTDSIAYKFVLKDSSDVLQATWDNISGINETQNASATPYTPGPGSLFSPSVDTVAEALDVLSDDETGSSFVGFVQDGNGAIKTTVQNAVRDIVTFKNFGAVGDGVTDDSVAIQSAIDYAVSVNKKIEITGNNGVYAVSVPIEYPASSLITLRNAKIVAKSTFDVSRYVVEVISQDAGLCNHDLTFENLLIDANHRGGCLRIDNYIRVTVFNCTFLHFSTCGLRLDSTLDSHECSISKVWAFEYLYNEPGYLTPTPTSVGLQINSFDNEVTQYVSYYTGYGIVVNAQYNLINQVHVGGGTYAIRITQNAAWTSIAQSYVDSASVLWENPWNSEITGTKFLTNTTNATFAFVVMKPMSANTYMQGAKITECSFHNIGAATVISVKNDTSSGTFDYANLRNNYIENNSFNNSTEAYTRLRTSYYQGAATTWTFNLANYLPIGSIQKVTHSYYCQTAATFPISVITNISGTNVTVTNSVASNGTVFIDVDVNVSYS